MPVATTIPTDAVRALDVSGVIERNTSTLRRGVVARRRRRHFMHDNRVAFSAALDLTAPFPGRGVFVHHRTGASLLATDRRGRARSATAADVVLAGVMRTRKQLRFRSFYLVGEHVDDTVSLIVHQRSDPAAGTPLVAGARIQSTLRGRTPFVIPRIMETGTAGRLPSAGVADWVVEELVDGAPVPMDDAATVVEQLVEELTTMWARLGVTHAPVDAAQRDRALSAFTLLATEPPDDIWPGDVDPLRLRRRVGAALDDRRPVTVGLSHGDPGIGNVLRLRDGGLALVDWEDAGHRHVAHDVVKVVMSAPDPARAASGLRLPDPLRGMLTAAGAMPWKRQVAVAVVLFLGGWRHRHTRAVNRGSVVASRRRMHTMLRVLDRLLDE